MEYKQPAITEAIRRRINSGIYQDQLPSSQELAAEFQVNVKTINKALAPLVATGLLERKRKSGTRVNSLYDSGHQLVEVIFEGFTTIFSHPFWSEIWSGMVAGLTQSGYHPVLNMLEADPKTGLLKLQKFSMIPSAGKIILGITEQRLLDQIAAAGVPCIAGSDLEDAAMPQISFDFSQGIADAIDYLYRQGCRRIAFIGQTRSYISEAPLHKFKMYRSAIQKYQQLDPELIEDTRPLADAGGDAMAALLKRTTPDAVLAAYDHQLPEILGVLREHRLNIPVIGCDGLNLPELPPDRHTVYAPRYELGEELAKSLVKAITSHTRPESKVIKAVFR